MTTAVLSGSESFLSRREILVAKVVNASGILAEYTVIGVGTLPNWRPVLVNGEPGALVTVRGRPIAVLGFVLSGERIVEIDAFGDPARVRRIAAAVLPAA